MKKSKAATTATVTLRLNGKSKRITAHPMTRLLDTIREDAGLTGTKEGCGEGECGACTVLMDGVPVLSCMTPLCQTGGRKITTIEGLAKGKKLHPLQEAFLREGGAQCGICTPGMIVSAAYYIDHPDAAEDLREALAGNQCRCTGFTKIFTSVESAAKAMRKKIPS